MVTSTKMTSRHRKIYLNQEKANYVQPSTFKIIVIKKAIVTEAIKAYAEDARYWLKLHKFANLIRSLFLIN